MTLTEFVDLKCPICRQFAPGAEKQLIARDVRAGRLVILGLTMIGFGFSAYLTYRELFSIHAICEWCVSSAVIMTILLVAAATRYISAPAATGAAVRRPPHSAAS